MGRLECEYVFTDFSIRIHLVACPLTNNGLRATWPDIQQSYSSQTIAALKQVTLASMDALQNFFFWTWKIGNSTVLGTSSSPMWHYKLGLEQGWIPHGASGLFGREPILSVRDRGTD